MVELQLANPKDLTAGSGRPPNDIFHNVAAVKPLFADIIARRYEAVSGVPANLEWTGERFAEVAARRSRESVASDREGGADHGGGDRSGATSPATSSALDVGE